MLNDIDDPFAELGLKPDATEEQVKAAWRRLVSQWHPDRNPSAAAVARMQRINHAFRTIRQRGFAGAAAGAGSAEADAGPGERQRGSADSRKTGPGHANAGNGSAGAGTANRSKAGRDGNGTGNSNGSSGPGPGTGAGSTSSNGTSHKRSSADAEHDPTGPRRTIRRRIRLSLEDAARGCTRELRGRVVDPCAPCEGVGYRVLGGHCRQCHGSGAVRQPTWFGWMGARTECEACHGNGIARETCSACEGSGKQPPVDYRVSVRIPAGVRDGDELHVDMRRLRPGTAPGDLAIRVELAPHPLLKLEEDGTIRCEMPVDGFVWIASRSIEIPTLAGPQRLELDRERLVYRLRGQGFPTSRRGAPGDQLVSITPIFPARIDNDQQILLDQLIAASAARRAAEASDDRISRWERSLREWKQAGRDDA